MGTVFCGGKKCGLFWNQRGGYGYWAGIMRIVTAGLGRRGGRGTSHRGQAMNSSFYLKRDKKPLCDLDIQWPNQLDEEETWTVCSGIIAKI